MNLKRELAVVNADLFLIKRSFGIEGSPKGVEGKIFRLSVLSGLVYKDPMLFPFPDIMVWFFADMSIP